MSSYEYTVIPAPARAEKTKGAKTGIERFAATLTDTLNDMARDGWDYVRAETLPAEERSGLASRSTVYHNVLVFRRALAAPATRQEAAAPSQSATPPAPQPDNIATANARRPFTAPMRPTAKPAPKPVDDNHARARMPDPPLTAPSPASPTGPRLGPANR